MVKILKRSSSKKRWLVAAVLVGVLMLLSSCSPVDDAVSPSQESTCPECEKLVCPEPVRYEDLWATSKHADAEAEAFTHWNEDVPQEIPVECAKCHSRPGFIDFLGVDGSQVGRVDKPAKIGTTITCFVCHNEATDDLSSATFPSGAKIRMLGPEARCVQCHQGRASTKTVDGAIAALSLTDPDEPSAELAFINVHSAPAAATAFGSEVQGGYQYSGKDYVGRFSRGDNVFSCIRCHDQHSLKLKFDTCRDCHTSGETDPKDIRVDTTDYDGDGNITEGIAYEIRTIQDALYEAIQAYATQVIGTPIAYDISTYPYFFIDTNANGEVDGEENRSANAFNAWTPRLLRAAYNYNYLNHDWGAYAHNSDYVLQLLYDSLADIGGDVSQMTRP